MLNRVEAIDNDNETDNDTGGNPPITHRDPCRYRFPGRTLKRVEAIDNDNETDNDTGGNPLHHSSGSLSVSVSWSNAQPVEAIDDDDDDDNETDNGIPGGLKGRCIIAPANGRG
jgi:hypothetical protein